MHLGYFLTLLLDKCVFSGSFRRCSYSPLSPPNIFSTICVSIHFSIIYFPCSINFCLVISFKKTPVVRCVMFWRVCRQYLGQSIKHNGSALYLVTSPAHLSRRASSLLIKNSTLDLIVIIKKSTKKQNKSNFEDSYHH